MIGRKLVVLLVLVGSFAQAQNRKFKKAEKLYEKGNYEKCIAKTLKLKKKYPKAADSYYFLSLSYFARFQNENKKYLFSKSLRYYKIGLNIDDSLFRLTDERLESIHQELLTQANRNYKKSSKNSKNQFNQLFNDTTTEYYILNDLISIKKEVALIDTLLNGDINRKYMLEVAVNLVGTPYKYGGEDTNGFDCSGFVKYIYQKVGLKLPHNAHMISKLGRKINPDSAKVGDIVLFGYKKGDSYRASHTGIVYKTGEDFTVIHCVNGGVKIAENDWENHWKEQVLFVKQIIED